MVGRCVYLQPNRKLFKVAKEYIFDVFPEFDLFKPENYYISDPFCLDTYNDGFHISKKEFQPIQATILAFCITMTE